MVMIDCMDMKNKTTLTETVYRQVRKNGSRGTQIETLLANARTIRRNAKKSDVRNALRKLNATEVRDGFYSVSANA